MNFTHEKLQFLAKSNIFYSVSQMVSINAIKGKHYIFDTKIPKVASNILADFY